MNKRVCKFKVCSVCGKKLHEYTDEGDITYTEQGKIHYGLRYCPETKGRFEYV